MADGTDQTHETRFIPPKLAEFWAQSFPEDGRQHTLVLGESHSHTSHRVWLRDHIDLLCQHDVKALGCEQYPFMNVFLWAYADGTLTRKLGSQQAARDYLIDVFSLAHYPSAASQRRVTAELIINAIDRGLQVFCYDGRKTRASFDHDIEYLHSQYPALATAFDGMAVESEKLRLTRQPLHAASEKQDKESDKFLLSFQWLHHELGWLLHENSHYGKRLDAIENALHVGHRLIEEGRMGSDGLSACLFQALAPDEGNRLAIAGFGHIDGAMKVKADVIKTIHGTFAEHLMVTQPKTRAGSVYTAVLGHEDKLEIHRANEAKRPRSLPRLAHAIAVVKIGDGSSESIHTFTAKDAERLHMEDALYEWYSRPDESVEETARQERTRVNRFANPMLIPKMKKACDAVHAAMHGEPQRAR